MKAYLALYEDRRKGILKPGDHRHEIGEPTEDCVNCMLNRAAAKLSAFETAVWNWYGEHVNQFAIDSGIVADEFRRMRIQGPARILALEAMNTIHQFYQAMAKNKAQE